MRKNDENTNAITQAAYTDMQEVKKSLAELQAKLDIVVYHIQRSTFDKIMGGPDLSEFFPAQTQEQLVNFMDRTHPSWPARRDEFYHLLFSITTTNKSCFTRGLFTTLFTREYMVTSKWPSFGY